MYGSCFCAWSQSGQLAQPEGSERPLFFAATLNNLALNSHYHSFFIDLCNFVLQPPAKKRGRGRRPAPVDDGEAEEDGDNAGGDGDDDSGSRDAKKVSTTSGVGDTDEGKKRAGQKTKASAGADANALRPLCLALQYTAGERSAQPCVDEESHSEIGRA